MSPLSARLDAALARGDGAALVSLYREAADQAASETEQGFFLTHAYVHALETAHPDAPDLRLILKAMGREE